MTDDELDRALRAARPRTGADDKWTESEAGNRALRAMHRAAAVSTSSGASPALRLHRARPIALGIGLAAAAAAVAALSLTTPSGPSRPESAAVAPPGTGTHLAPIGPAPSDLALAAYTSCDAMLAGLRQHTAAHITANGLEGYGGLRYAVAGTAKAATLSPALSSSVPAPAGSVAADAPDHSTTNDQEAGVDEPDIVESDGTRIVSVSDGVLRVVDAATRKITGSLDLTMYAGASSAQLLMSGDRVLVLLGGSSTNYPGFGPISSYDYGSSGTSSAFLLVDLSGSPKIVGTLHAKGGFVDARMVDGTARIVVSSVPKLVIPTPTGRQTAKQRLAHNRSVVEQAPLSAWLPTYDTTDGQTTTSHTVPCDAVSHPKSYTGTSMLTVYSVDLATRLNNAHPISIAADGSAVYASASSLYVASSTGSKTQLHRFDISGSGAPGYLGSGTVPGQLLDAYSMSDYNGSLRVVTTTGRYTQQTSTAVYVLDANTLRVTGHVGGLGRNEQVHAVRFLGPLAYVVTFESVDPLYVLDLHDPAKPRAAGELTITGYSDYLHPVGDGRLLGVGESVDANRRVSGLQVSLFDVSAPTDPKRIDRITRQHTPSEVPIDPHAFLYWPAAKLAVLPINSWNPVDSGAALVVRVGADGLKTVGTIRNPAVSNTGSYDTGIERTLVIGGDIWTMSSSGLQVSDLKSLAPRAWVPFT
jgi:uncharacterized secreted protein with C-terminal beta-propeller domain